MNILTIKYANVTDTAIVITLEDGSSMSAPYPCKTWHNNFIDKFLEEGNEIETYMTSEELTEAEDLVRIQEIEAEAKEQELLLIPGVAELRLKAQEAKDKGDSLESFKSEVVTLKVKYKV